MKKLYLHIGMPKVASSTIQNFIYGNSDKLSGKNILVPSFLGRKNNRLLYSYVKNEFGEADSSIFRRGLKTEQEVIKFFEGVKRKINSHFSSDYQKVLVSCEQLASLDRPELEFLHAFLSQYFSDIRIVLYLRRQDIRLVSGYSTQVISGRGDLFSKDFAFPDPKRNNLDYYDFVRKWSSFFGKKAIYLRVLEKKYLKGGSVVSDFQEVIEESFCDDDDYKYTENKSVPAALIEVIRKVNIELKKDSFDQYQKAEIGALTHELAKACKIKGERFYPSREKAEDFYAHFENSNNRLAKEFLGRDELFEKDFSMYPDSDSLVDASSEAEASIQLIAELLRSSLNK